MHLGRIKFVVIYFVAISSSFAQNPSKYLAQDDTELFYGKVYHLKQYNSEGHPFFLNDNLLDASIEYRKITYKDLHLKYDLQSQDVILSLEKYEDLPRYILLNNSQLNKFEIRADNRVYMFKAFKDIKGLPRNIKYYEVKYEGNLKYIVGRQKFIKEELSVYISNRKFVEIEKHIIIKGNEAYIFKNKRDFIKIFCENKKEIKHYIKKEKLEIGTNNPQEIIKTILFCEKL